MGAARILESLAWSLKEYSRLYSFDTISGITLIITENNFASSLIFFTQRLKLRLQRGRL